jgi:putative transposase
MSQNPRLHRGTLRFPEYDYTSAGADDVTLGTHRHDCLFGEVSTDQVLLNSFGEIVLEEWLRTPDIRPEIILYENVIMPNHIHGIVIISEPIAVGAHSLVPVLR